MRIKEILNERKPELLFTDEKGRNHYQVYLLVGAAGYSPENEKNFVGSQVHRELKRSIMLQMYQDVVERLEKIKSHAGRPRSVVSPMIDDLIAELTTPEQLECKDG